MINGKAEKPTFHQSHEHYAPPNIDTGGMQSVKSVEKAGIFMSVKDGQQRVDV